MNPEYNTVTFIDIYPDFETFEKYYLENGIPALLEADNIKTLYYLLVAKYKNEPIANNDYHQFVSKTFSIIFQYGPTWERRLEIQKRLRELSEDDLMKGATNIYNTALNPGEEPTMATSEELPYINQQNINKYKRSLPDAYNVLWDLLRVDVTEAFLKQFKKLFKVIVFPESPLLYCDEESEEE